MPKNNAHVPIVNIITKYATDFLSTLIRFVHI